MNNNDLRKRAIRAYNAMMARVHTHKNYTTVVVDSRWKNDRESYIQWYFTNFKDPSWAVDKDILVPNSRKYSPETCMFVPPYVNALFRAKKENSRGNASNSVTLPLGVSAYDSETKPYYAHCKINGVQTHLGLFSTPEDAHRAWQYGKIDQLQYILHDDQLTPEIIEAIENWIEIIIDDIDNGRETKLN